LREKIENQENRARMRSTIVIHYHEINLKGNNRGWFEKRLQDHIVALLREIPHGGLHRTGGRMFIGLTPESPVREIIKRLKTVFGVANFAVARQVPADLDAIKEALTELIRKRDFESFKIDTRRGTKDFPMNSQQVNEELGHMVQAQTSKKVRLDGPDLTCFVELVGKNAYLSFEKIPGGGGLPTRTGGKVLSLLSGGIDSPVAAYRLLRRGCSISFLHFHSFPHTTLESQEKVRRILQILSRYQLGARLYLAPFAPLQREILTRCPAPLRVVLYRRFMMRIAETLAIREGMSGLITGDSMGQVASQTLENLRVVTAVTTLPVFRPLIGDDKEHIIRTAREIGTYEISILPDQDCCTVFVPRHPETMATTEQVDAAEAHLDVKRLVSQALKDTTRELIEPDFSDRVTELPTPASACALRPAAPRGEITK
jgi:thiamine biosynthesis protein ThiI